jgi:glycosyltransferase involved in cell wall biosynthesis
MSDSWEAARSNRKLLERAPQRQDAQRRLAQALIAQSDYSGAFDILRKMARNPAAKTPDLKLLFIALRMTSPQWRNRWLRRLHYRNAAKLIAPMDYARLLMIADEIDAAATCYAALDPRDLSQEAARFCFTHFVNSCQFGAAEAIRAARPAQDLDVTPKLLSRHEEGLALSRRWGIGPADDFWHAAVARLTELTAPLRDAYRPNTRSLLVCLAQTAIGGAERQAELLAEAASTRCRAKVTLLSLSADDPPFLKASSEYARRGIGDFMNCATVRQSIGWFDEVQAISRLLYLKHLAPMLEAIVQLRPGVVHNGHQSNLDVLMATILMGVPCLLAKLEICHPSRIQVKQSAWVGFLNKTYRHAAQFHATLLVANSRAGLLDWAEHSGLPQQRFQYIHNAFEAVHLGRGCADRAAFRRSLGFPEGALVVGGAFRFADVKDPLLWIEVARSVARRVPEAHFLLVGDGPLLKPVRARVHDLGLADRFHCPGPVVDDMLAWYQAMDVFLLTSRAEGLPNVIIEAQYAGLPVVTVDVGGTAEAIASSKTGKVVGTRSAGALADAVVGYLNDASQRQQVAAMAPQLIKQRFSIEAHIQAYETLYGWVDRPRT